MMMTCEEEDEEDVEVVVVEEETDIENSDDSKPLRLHRPRVSEGPFPVVIL